MPKRRKTEIVQVNLRLREEFRQRLVREAEKWGRSFNQELVYRLEQSFARQEQEDAVYELKEWLTKQQDRRLAAVLKATERWGLDRRVTFRKMYAEKFPEEEENETAAGKHHQARQE